MTARPFLTSDVITGDTVMKLMTMKALQVIFQAGVVDDLNNIFAQDALLKTSGGFSFLADDRWDFVTDLQRSSNIGQSLGFELADTTETFVKDIESSRLVNTEVKKEVEFLKGLVSVAKRSTRVLCLKILPVYKNESHLQMSERQIYWIVICRHPVK